jgi:prepilin-type N-terminal cleavage/methylation domain-containing protein
MEPTPIHSLANPSRFSRGFTLIEMVVVLGIIGVISTVILTGQSAYNQSLVLSDTTYSLAFSIRQAQVFGISSRSFGGVNNVGYGLYFDSTTPKQYIVYADSSRIAIPQASGCPVGTLGTPDYKAGNCRYDASRDNIINTSLFTRGFTISKFCMVRSGTKYCSTDPAPLQKLDIVFLRPSTQAVITGTKSNAFWDPGTCAEITIKAPTGGATNTVRVSKYGEISINQTCS